MYEIDITKKFLLHKRNTLLPIIEIDRIDGVEENDVVCIIKNTNILLDSLYAVALLYDEKCSENFAKIVCKNCVIFHGIRNKHIDGHYILFENCLEVFDSIRK